MRSTTRLQPVGEEAADDFQLADPPTVERKPSIPERQMLDLLIKGFGQRALTLLSTLFTLLIAGSVFWAWMTVLPSPSTPQLIGVGGYAVFVLALEFVRRR